MTVACETTKLLEIGYEFPKINSTISNSREYNSQCVDCYAIYCDKRRSFKKS